MNKDGVRLATEAGTAVKRVRELEMHGKQTQLALDQARADRARMKAERDVLCTTIQTQVEELAMARTGHGNMVGGLAKLSVLLEAQ